MQRRTTKRHSSRRNDRQNEKSLLPFHIQCRNKQKQKDLCWRHPTRTYPHVKTGYVKKPRQNKQEMRRSKSLKATAHDPTIEYR